MKFARILALLLCVSLCLTACGTTASTSGSSASASSSATVADESAIPQAAIDDVVSYLTDGAYAATDVVAQVGDVSVTAAEALYWTAYQQYYMTYYFYAYYSVSIDMSDDMGDGTTVGEYLLQLGLDTAVANAVTAAKAPELGVSLLESDQAVLDTLYEDNVASYGEDRWDTYVDAGLIDEADFDDEAKQAWILEQGESFYNHSMMYYATTADAYEALLTNNYYYNILQDDLFGEGGLYEATDETLSDYLNTYIDDNGVIWGRCILFSTQSCADETEEAEVLEQAQQVYNQLAGLEGDALSEAFTEMQSQYDESGYTAGEVQYYTNSDSLVDGYYDGLAALSAGELGMTEKTDYGYFLLLREEDQTDDLTSTVKSDYITSTYQTLIAQWQSEYGCDGLTLDLDVDGFYERLSDLQLILAQVDTVASTSDSTAADSGEETDDTDTVTVSE